MAHSNTIDKHPHYSLVLVSIGAYIALIALTLLLRPLLETIGGAVGFALNFLPLLFIPALPLLLLALMLDRRPLTLALAALPVLAGVLLYHHALLPKPAIALQADGFRVLTYNMSSRSFDRHGISAFLLEQNADIMTIQEFHLIRHPRLFNLITPHYPYEITQPVDGGWRANITFSRHPIIASTAYDDIESLYTRLCVNGRALDLYNINLAAPSLGIDNGVTGLRVPDYIFSYDTTRRNAQLDLLLERIDADHADPLILAGDFNLSDQDTRYNSLAARWHDSFVEVGVGFGFTWPTPDSGEIPIPAFIPPLLRVDYVFHNEALQAARAVTRRGVESDHLAVIVDFNWRGHTFTAC